MDVEPTANGADAAPQRLGSSRRVRAALLAAVLTVVGWYLVVIGARPTLVGDESYHFPAIAALAWGDWGLVRELPLLPTYHWLASLVAGVAGCELWVLRGFNGLLAVLTMALFHLAAKACHPHYGPHHFLRFVWNPLLWPLWVLVYTEPASLLGIILALNFQIRGRHWAAAGGLLLACLFRQSNLVWTGLFAGLTAMQMQADSKAGHGPRPSVGRLLAAIGPYLLLGATGTAFLLVYGSQVLTFKVENRPRPNVAQFYILALTAAALWLPLWLPHLIRNWSRTFQKGLTRPRVCMAIVAAVGLLELIFSNPHPWNLDRHYLRNWPLYAMTYSVLARYLLATVIVAFVVSFGHLTWRSAGRPTLILVWAFSLLYLLPHYLVDPRYYIIPFVLVDFFTPYLPTQARWLTAWYLLLVLAVGIYVVVQPGGWSGVW